MQSFQAQQDVESQHQDVSVPADGWVEVEAAGRGSSESRCHTTTSRVRVEHALSHHARCRCSTSESVADVGEAL